ncbi:MAG TPA: hypothetical protein VEB67_01450, partial [Nitrososphaerales archaeon]|nr:hypothetical protein [Nitrososphaerales archaeon]
GKMHMIIGAKFPTVVKIAAQRADEWNHFSLPMKDYLSLKATFDSALGDRKVDVTEAGPYLIARSRSDLERYADMLNKKEGVSRSPKETLGLLKERGSPSGTVDEFVADLRSKGDNGIQRYYFQTIDTQNTEMIELLADTLRSGV